MISNKFRIEGIKRHGTHLTRPGDLAPDVSPEVFKIKLADSGECYRLLGYYTPEFGRKTPTFR